jgi:uncharacterized membrane protein
VTTGPAHAQPRRPTIRAVNDRSLRWSASGVAVGAALGLLFGLMLDQVIIWVVLGAVIGGMFGVVGERSRRD